MHYKNNVSVPSRDKTNPKSVLNKGCDNPNSYKTSDKKNLSILNNGDNKHNSTASSDL